MNDDLLTNEEIEQNLANGVEYYNPAPSGDSSGASDSDNVNSSGIHLDDDSIERLVDAFKESNIEDDSELEEDEEDLEEDEEELEEELEEDEEDFEEDEEDLEEDEGEYSLYNDSLLSDSGDSLQTSVTSLPVEFYDKLEEIRIENFFFNSIILGLIICFIFVFGLKR